MSLVLPPQRVLPAIAAVDGPIVTNTNQPSSLLPPDAVLTIPGGTLGIGSIFKLTATGKFSNRANAPGSLTLEMRMGAAVVWSSGALNPTAVLRTDLTWWLELMLSCTKNGAAAKMLGVGLLHVDVGAQGHYELPTANPVESAAFDSTVDRDLDFFATWSVADAGNKMQVKQYLVIA